MIPYLPDITTLDEVSFNYGKGDIDLANHQRMVSSAFR